MMIPTELRPVISKLKAVVKRIPNNAAVQFFCAIEVIRAYQKFEVIFWESTSNPIPMLTKEFHRLGGVLAEVNKVYSNVNFQKQVTRKDFQVKENIREDQDVKTWTGQLYSNLFTKFEDESYFDEAADLLMQRIGRNKIGFEWLKGKKGLDAGCGGGRYTVALTKLGAREVTGIDYGKVNIKDAKRRVKAVGIKNVHFRHADVLNIPYKDNRFDFVFSNGVLHHTTDPFLGLEELQRVLKPGGHIWIFLYGKSLWWEMMDVIRKVAEKAPYDLTYQIMQQMGYAPNRIFKFLDSLYVPIIKSYSSLQVEEMLNKKGFVNLMKLSRGVKTPFFKGVNEMLWNEERFAKVKWGEGEIRYLAQKSNDA